MACHCTVDREATAALTDAFDRIGLKATIERLFAAREQAVSTVVYLKRAERAQVLELGPDVVALHRSEAERSNRWVRRQLQVVDDELAERTGAEDWAGVVDETSRRHDDPEARQMMLDAHEAGRRAFADLDGLSGEDTAYLVKRYDEISAIARSDGLDGLIAQLRKLVQEMLSALDSPEMGSQRGSPEVAFIACIIAASVAYFIAMLLCIFVFCSAGFVITMAFVAALGACTALAFGLTIAQAARG